MDFIGNVMEHVKRFIFILFLFASSLIFIHTTRNSTKGASEEIRIACLPIAIAQKLEADTHLKWDAHIAYDTVEKNLAPPSYRCYISFPANDVVCTPQQVANRKDLQSCPTFPALWSPDRTCYFLNSKHYPFHKKLASSQRMSILDLQGKVVHSIEEAKKVLKGIS